MLKWKRVSLYCQWAIIVIFALAGGMIMITMTWPLSQHDDAPLLFLTVFLSECCGACLGGVVLSILGCFDKNRYLLGQILTRGTVVRGADGKIVKVLMQDEWQWRNEQLYPGYSIEEPIPDSAEIRIIVNLTPSGGTHWGFLATLTLPTDAKTLNALETIINIYEWRQLLLEEVSRAEETMLSRLSEYAMGSSKLKDFPEEVEKALQPILDQFSLIIHDHMIWSHVTQGGVNDPPQKNLGTIFVR